MKNLPLIFSFFALVLVSNPIPSSAGPIPVKGVVFTTTHDIPVSRAHNTHYTNYILPRRKIGSPFELTGDSVRSFDYQSADFKNSQVAYATLSYFSGSGPAQSNYVIRAGTEFKLVSAGIYDEGPYKGMAGVRLEIAEAQSNQLACVELLLYPGLINGEHVYIENDISKFFSSIR